MSADVATPTVVTPQRAWRSSHRCGPYNNNNNNNNKTLCLMSHTMGMKYQGLKNNNRPNNNSEFI